MLMQQNISQAHTEAMYRHRGIKYYYASAALQIKGVQLQLLHAVLCRGVARQQGTYFKLTTNSALHWLSPLTYKHQHIVR